MEVGKGQGNPRDITFVGEGWPRWWPWRYGYYQERKTAQFTWGGLSLSALGSSLWCMGWDVSVKNKQTFPDYISAENYISVYLNKIYVFPFFLWNATFPMPLENTEQDNDTECIQAFATTTATCNVVLPEVKLFVSVILLSRLLFCICGMYVASIHLDFH